MPSICLFPNTSKKLKYSGKPVNDYIDFFRYLKAQDIIRNVVICYEPDQWVYSGAIGRESDFQFSGEECRYHDIQFILYRLEHRYRISPDGQDSDSGTNFVKGIRYFLQFDTDSSFNREVFRQDPRNTGAISGSLIRYRSYSTTLTKKETTSRIAKSSSSRLRS